MYYDNSINLTNTCFKRRLGMEGILVEVIANSQGHQSINQLDIYKKVKNRPEGFCYTAVLTVFKLRRQLLI